MDSFIAKYIAEIFRSLFLIVNIKQNKEFGAVCPYRKEEVKLKV